MDKKLIEILTDLKNNHNVSSIKAEFETEGASLQDIFRLKALAVKTNLNLTVKIGGCGALRDLLDSKEVGVNAIVAPMIESSYALKKFVETAKSVFSEDELKNIKLFMNIETITGYEKIDEILSIKESDSIDGIVFGRCDMLNSLELSNNDSESNELLAIADNIALKAAKYNKKLIVGGGISPQSSEFLKRVNLSGFETRKIIFNSEELNSFSVKDGILKALDFEILWLKSKPILCQNEFQRLSTLNERCNTVLN